MHTICLAPTEQASQFVGQRWTLWWHVKHFITFVFFSLSISYCILQITKHSRRRTWKRWRANTHKRMHCTMKILLNVQTLFKKCVSFHFDLIYVYVFVFGFLCLFRLLWVVLNLVNYTLKDETCKHEHHLNLIIVSLFCCFISLKCFVFPKGFLHKPFYFSSLLFCAIIFALIFFFQSLMAVDKSK